MSVHEMIERLTQCGTIGNAQGAENRWFAGVALGHEPSCDEAVVHYYNHAGPHYRVHEFSVTEQFAPEVETPALIAA